MIKVSIIVPFYNAGYGIKKTIDSIQRQSLKEIEVIFVDDGSTDESASLVDSYTADERIKLVRKENEGVSSARNRGIAEARGEYIGFVDSDDWIEKDMYKEMYSLAVESGADICICGFVRERDGYTENEDLNLSGINGEDSEAIKKQLVFSMVSGEDPLKWDGIVMGSVWRMIYRRNTILEQSILFDEELAIMEDTVFCLESLLASGNIVASDKSYYHYVYSSDSAVNRYREDFYDQIKAVSKRTRDLLKKSSYYGEELEKRMSWRYIKLCIWAIANEVGAGTEKSFGEKTRCISEICEDAHFKNSIAKVKKSNYNFRNRIKLFLLERNMGTILYFYFKLAEKSKKGELQ